MAEPSSWRPERSDSDSDRPPRPPTFVQVRPPAAPGGASRTFGLLGAGLALVLTLGWAGWQMTRGWDAPVPAAPVPTLADAATPRQVPADLYDELARRAVDTAVAAPAWSRESLVDRLSPFEAPVSDGAPSAAPPADTADARPDGPFKISLRLAKGETIGGALHRLGFAADEVAGVIPALARQVRLKRLPVGLGMTVQVQPPGEKGGKPILQALTLHPEGRSAIKVERDGAGNYAMERPPR